ncbi:PucR family transcriptional regulator [Nocardioides sp.]|uniref:PucR family transcriptional regulator n=1 Tax=Nocardioides sp. TaxID=35761 RepID=UPI0035163035
MTDLDATTDAMTDAMTDAADSSPADIVAALMPERDRLATEVLDEVARALPELTRDRRAREALRAAAIDNVLAAMEAIATEARLEEVAAPDAALDHARLMAQREQPLTTLLRAYRLGQTTFLEGVVDAARARGLDPGDSALDLIRSVSTYIDRISDLVAITYEQERELWLGNRAALRQLWVGRLLSGEPLDAQEAQAALGYRLDGWHRVADLWVEDPTGRLGALDRAAALIARATRCRGEALSVPQGAGRRRLWLHVEPGSTIDTSDLAPALRDLGAHAALGPAREGLPGFRAAAEGAQRVRDLMLSADAGAPPVLDHARVAPLTLITRDDAEGAAFVAATLGDLAVPDPRHAALRETLLAYLEAQRSYHAAAGALHVHRNTVHYRVQQAIALLGRDLEADTFAIHLALLLTRWRRPRG